MQPGRVVMPRMVVGFTLIELMIVVTIVGILAMIAYPAYQQQVRESRRPEAHSALAALANDLEKFRSECGVYPPDSAGGVATITGARNTCTGLGRGGNLSTNQNYTLTLRTAGPAPAGGYLLTATAQTQQAGDKDCQTLSLNSLGQTSATAGTGGNTAKCWRK